MMATAICNAVKSISRLLILCCGLALLAVVGLPATVDAVPYYWNTGSSSWATGANWSDNAVSGGTTGVVPGATSTATFNQSSVNGTETITLGAQSAQGLVFTNTGAANPNTTLSGGSLNLGVGGITVNSGAGIVTISSPITFNGSQSIGNNSSVALNISGTSAGSGSPIITNNGTGTGVVNFASPGAVGATVTKIIQNSDTSRLNFRTNSNSFGNLEIWKGTVGIGNGGSVYGNGAVTIGNSAGGSDAATLLQSNNGNDSYNRAIVLASTTTGLLTIGIEDDISGVFSGTFTGGVTGNNSLTIENRSGNETLAFTTATLNNVGNITHTGAGTGFTNITSVIGSNVSQVIQNSSTSQLNLRSNVNAFANLQILKGTVQIGNGGTAYGTGAMTLGNSAGGSDAATLLQANTGTDSYSRAITLASNTTGLLTVAIDTDSVVGVSSGTFTGGVTGNNSFTIENRAGNETLTFSTATVNNAGTITHIGAGTGSTTISSVIGSNVTGLTQNSSTSALLLSGANTFAGPTVASAGNLQLGNVLALQNSPLNVSGAGSVTFNVAGTNNYTLGGLTGNGSLNAGANSLSVKGIAPGNSAGLVNITASTMTLSATSTFELNGTARGTQYDAVDLSGALVYGGILNVQLGFSPTNTTLFDLFNFGSQIGTFSTINILNNAGYIGNFDYATGVLSITPIPEPSSLALLGLGGLLLRARRKRA